MPNTFCCCGWKSPLVLFGAMFAAVLIVVSSQTVEPVHASAEQQPPQANPARPPVRPTAPAGSPAYGQQHQGHPASPLGPPPVEFHPSEFDLGTIRPNARVTGTVHMQNVSDRSLRVVSTRSDCSCTSVDLSNIDLAPGESVPVQIEYHATGPMGDWRGAIRILIAGYDLVEIPAKGLVALPVHAEPAFISALADPNGRRTLSGEFEVRSEDGQPFRILAVNGEEVPYVGFDPQSDELRNTYKLKWDFTRYNPQTCRDDVGRLLPAWMVIETDHPDCPIFDMEVRHECNRRQIQRTDSWIVQEKRVMLGEVKPGEFFEFELHVKWMPRATVRDPANAVTSEMKGLTVELLGSTPTDDGLVCRLRVKPDSGHRGLIYGPIRLHSSRQNATVLLIGTVR